MQNSDNPSYIYTRLFCEENIWKLVQSLYMNNIAKPIDVLFLLNKSNSIALYNQSQSPSNSPAIWDYHVILCARLADNIVIYDFDSQCDFPANIADYFNRTFPDKVNLAKTYQPFIKPISAEHFLKHFFSDRHHMEGLISTEEYPDYKIITPTGRTKRLTLEQCRDTQYLISNQPLTLPSIYFSSISK